MVGDRHFTDVVYGNRNGFLTILSEPLNLSLEPFIVKQDKRAREIVLKAMGQAISKAVAIVEIIKKRIPGLYQDTSISSSSITHVWEPIEESLVPLETTRHVSMITITLSTRDLNINSPGYQVPLNLGHPRQQPRHQSRQYQVGQPYHQSRQAHNQYNDGTFIFFFSVAHLYMGKEVKDFFYFSMKITPMAEDVAEVEEEEEVLEEADMVDMMGMVSMEIMKMRGTGIGVKVAGVEEVLVEAFHHQVIGAGYERGRGGRGYGGRGYGRTRGRMGGRGRENLVE